MELVCDMVTRNRVPFRVRMYREGEDLLVDFLDLRYGDPDGNPGQHTGARFHVETLLGEDGYGIGWGEVQLDHGNPEWTVDEDMMRTVRHWLRINRLRIGEDDHLGSTVHANESMT